MHRMESPGITSRGSSLVVPLLIKVELLLELFFAQAFCPLVVRAVHNVCGYAGKKRLSFGNEFRVESLGNLVEAVPLCVVRAHHCRAHPSAPSLVMPELIVGPFDLFIERCLRQLISGIELVHDRFGWFGKLLVVEIDRVLVLLIEVLYPASRVAVRADILHGGTTLLPVFQLDADDWP